MSATGIAIFHTCLTALVGLTLVLVPRYGRRGLLFGVYIGEDAHDSDEARDLRGRWTWFTSLVALLSVAIAATLGFLGLGELSRVGPFVMLLGFSATFTWAYLVARKLAVENHAPAVAVLQITKGHKLFPSLTLGFVLVFGAAIFAYALVSYPDLPPRVPTEFNEAGQGIGHIDKSFGAVLLLPFLTLFVGGFLALLGLLMTGAKRSLRHPQTRSSAEAQTRFRTAISRFVSGVALLITLMLGLMSLGIVETAHGHPTPLLVLGIAVGGLVFFYTIGGVIYLVVRYGQGGGRLEQETSAGEPGALTNGLADNRLWKLGVFYVNRDDPSLFVEKRFGLGYTVNFANPKAVGLMVGFLILMVVVVVVTFAGL